LTRGDLQMTRRAIVLGGGGPAAGLHIGALRAFEEAGIRFDVWSLSCIGAWVGVVYNQFDENAGAQTESFFRDNVFRDDASYSRFPINRMFAPDYRRVALAVAGFVLDPSNYCNLFLPVQLMKAGWDTMQQFTDPRRWNEGDINHWFLNSVLAVNPAVRFLTSLVYLSNINGLARICYPGSSFLQTIQFDKLYSGEKPFIYHNAWNLTRRRMDLFSNERKEQKGNGDITLQSLCACSALPFVEETVEIKGQTYCEGALVDILEFHHLLDRDPELDEIWISRIVDDRQARPPRNLTEGLDNLCMLFAGAVGVDNIALFRDHIQQLPPTRKKPKIYELRTALDINFDWSHSNLDRGILDGRRAAQEALNHLRSKGDCPGAPPTGGPPGDGTAGRVTAGSAAVPALT
jgi:predicted acylesterase/phospholipase RssA